MDNAKLKAKLNGLLAHAEGFQYFALNSALACLNDPAKYDFENLSDEDALTNFERFMASNHGCYRGEVVRVWVIAYRALESKVHRIKKSNEYLDSKDPLIFYIQRQVVIDHKYNVHFYSEDIRAKAEDDFITDELHIANQMSHLTDKYSRLGIPISFEFKEVG